MRDPGTRSAVPAPRMHFWPSWTPRCSRYQKLRYGGRESTAVAVGSRCTGFPSVSFTLCAETSSRSWQWRITAASQVTGAFGSVA